MLNSSEFAPAIYVLLSRDGLPKRPPRKGHEPQESPAPIPRRLQKPPLASSDEREEHDDPKAGRAYDSGNFTTGQLRPADDIADFIRQHVSGQPKGAKIPVPTFELGELSESAVDLLRKHASSFDVVPGRLYVSGRALKHVDEQRSDFLPTYADRLPDIVRNPDMILPNPTRPDPWERPWMYKKLDDGIATIVEVRANGSGIDIVNIVEPVERSRLRRALDRAQALGLGFEKLTVRGR